jgi:prophage maintenance system killer protein
MLTIRSDFESGVFGEKKDGNFDSDISQISKSFGDEDFYPTLEEKATTLLYLFVKNHSYVNGNKWIGEA